jgi:hypothetical protein
MFARSPTVYRQEALVLSQRHIARLVATLQRTPAHVVKILDAPRHQWQYSPIEDWLVRHQVRWGSQVAFRWAAIISWLLWYPFATLLADSQPTYLPIGGLAMCALGYTGYLMLKTTPGDSHQTTKVLVGVVGVALGVGTVLPMLLSALLHSTTMLWLGGWLGGAAVYAFVPILSSMLLDQYSYGRR